MFTACLEENNPQDKLTARVTSVISPRAEIWGMLGTLDVKLVSEKGCFKCSPAPYHRFEKIR